MNSPIESLPLPQLYYHSPRQDYYMPDETEKWICVNESSAKRLVKSHGYLLDEGESGISQVDQCLLDIQRKQNVAYASKLAGHHAGFYEINGNKILVTQSPKLITPKPGEWPLLKEIFEGMFVTETTDQTPYFYGWLKKSLEQFYNRRWSQGQVLAMAGPKHSGKSLTQFLITEMFGGREAKPFMFMTGHTTFNADLFQAEHLAVDDEAESVDYKARRTFGAHIKQVAVVKQHNCHGKNKDGVVLCPLWRMSISLNDEAERLLVLPPLADDLEDKLMLLKVAKKVFPRVATRDGETDQDAFRRALLEELPAFIHHLIHWQIPEEFGCSRFGIKTYHHPELVLALKETAPEVTLLGLIDEVYFRHGLAGAFETNALQIQRKLLDKENGVAFTAAQLFRHPQACGTWLTRLADDPDEPRVSKRVLHGAALYRILPPGQESENAANAQKGGGVESKSTFTLFKNNNKEEDTGAPGHKPPIWLHPSTLLTTQNAFQGEKPGPTPHPSPSEPAAAGDDGGEVGAQAGFTMKLPVLREVVPVGLPQNNLSPRKKPPEQQSLVLTRPVKSATMEEAYAFLGQPPRKETVGENQGMAA